MEATFPHPSLSAQEAEVLTLLAEEASEVAIECSKILRSGRDFCRRGRDVPNTQHLMLEITDFVVIFSLVKKLGLVPAQFDTDAAWDAKVEKLKQWSNIGHLFEELGA